MILRSLKEMQARDWVALILIAAVVAACGVFGVSYVVGEGWPIFDALQTGLLCLAATAVCAVILFLVDAWFEKISAAQTRTVKGAEYKPSETAVVVEPAGTAEAAEAAEVVKPAEASATIESSATAESSKPRNKAKRKSKPKPEKKHRARRVLAKITPRWNAKSIALFSAIMLLFWLPWFIANLPGTTYWDTYYQMYMTYPENHPISIIPFAGYAENTVTDAWLTDHHPVLTTLIYGAFAQISDQLTGNWMAGVFAFVCIQTVLFLVEFTACVAYLRARKCPIGLCFAAYVFFAIMPFVSTWAMCMVKDSMFALFFVPYFMMMFEAVRTRGRSFCRPRTIVLFTLCALMLCLTKKTGPFIVIPVTIIGMWLFRPSKIREEWILAWGEWLTESEQVAWASECKRAKRPLICFLVQGITCVAIASVLLPCVLFPAFNIAPGGRQEALGPMFQQTARYMVDNGREQVTTDEYWAISDILDYNTVINKYAFDDQDDVKYTYNLDATNEELLAYGRAYLQMGVKDPESYFAAIMSLAGFYVAPTDYLNIRMVTVDTKMGDDQRYMLWNPDSLDGMRTGMDEIYSAIGLIPVLNLPLLMVTYVLWIPAMLFYTMFRRRVKCGIMFVPLVVLIAFCVIAPVSDARYVIPIFDALPLFVCAMAILLRQRLAIRKSALQAEQRGFSYQNPRIIYVKRARTITM